MPALATTHRETLLIEILLSSLDLRATARDVDSPMLVYLAEMLVRRTREELEASNEKIEPSLSRSD